jgi:hypothetical protein
MVVEFRSTGSFQKTEDFLQRLSKQDIFAALDSYARAGVEALKSATPFETGVTSESWSYQISKSFGTYKITWSNSHVVNGVPVVIMLQYGHGTGTGGYVQGRDFINPAIRPIFDKISSDVWKAVTSA